MATLQLIAPATIEAKAAEGSEPKKGPRRFEMLAYSGGPMKLDQLPLPVVVDLNGLAGTGKARPAFLGHDRKSIVGHIDAYEKAETLRVRGAVSGVGPAAQEVLGAADNGFPWQASIGVTYDAQRLIEVSEGRSVQVNGRTWAGPLLVARKTALAEISFVPRGADDSTYVSISASAEKTGTGAEAMTFEQWLEARGFKAADLSEAQKTALQADFDATLKAAAHDEPEDEADAEPDPVEAQRALMAAEANRVASLEAVYAKYAGQMDAEKAAKLRASAIGDNWQADKLELELMRAARPKAPAAHFPAASINQQVLEASLCISAGIAKPEDHFSAEVLNEATRRGNRNVGLQEVLLMAAFANGYAGRHTVHQGNIDEVLRAAFSTNSVTTLLTTTGNKILLDGFNSLPQSWREVASTRTVNDFKTVTAYRMTASLEYEEVGPGGEIKHGTLGQESYEVTAKTYAKMLALTRQDIINDDLGAFNDIRTRLGVGAAIKMNKVFWTAWCAASTAGVFWSSTHKNLSTSSALAEAGLNSAVQLFRDLPGPDGNMMNLEPVLLLVPSALEATARKIYTSQEVRDTTASTKFQTANIYQNRFRPVVVPELGNISYTGYSATTWWLLADPRVMASAQMAFLGGQQAPTIETAEADFSTLGVQFRGYHDFGVGMTEYRASVKATA